ncbi:MAG: lmo0937 family membrane protein [bacterium]|nr:lmo0937 family membrane protein [bacterium]
MLLKIIAVLLVLWILGFSFNMGGGLIHVLLVVALVAVIIKLLS